MTATRRELGIGEDQGQARTRGAWMLKPDAFGAMTAVLDVPAQRRRKPRGHNGLTGDCRHRDPQDGKSGRNSVCAVVQHSPPTFHLVLGLLGVRV